MDQSVMVPINKTYRTFNKSTTEDLRVINSTYASIQYYCMLAYVGFVNKKREDAKKSIFEDGIERLSGSLVKNYESKLRKSHKTKTTSKFKSLCLLNSPNLGGNPVRKHLVKDAQGKPSEEKV
jgi:hypothetical protein